MDYNLMTKKLNAVSEEMRMNIPKKISFEVRLKNELRIFLSTFYGIK